MLLVGCQSTQIKYIVIVPELDYPIFPTTDDIVNNRNGTCTVPSDWIVKIKEFHIEYERLEKDYTKIKEKVGK